MIKKIKYLFIIGCFFAFASPLESCAKKNCITYSSSTTTGNLSKSVKKSAKAKKKKAKKKGGKMKKGKPLF